MDQAQCALLSQLIGLARATDGSEHLITPQAVRTVTQALAAIARGQTEGQTEAVIQAKGAMVPNCFTCAQPCGRTSPFDLALLEEEPEHIRRAKQELAQLLCTLAAGNPGEEFARAYFFLGLIAIGTQLILEEPLTHLLTVLRRKAQQEE